MKVIQFSHLLPATHVYVDRPKFRQKQPKSTHAFLTPERMSQLLRCTLVRATCDGAKKTTQAREEKSIESWRAHLICVQRLKLKICSYELR